MPTNISNKFKTRHDRKGEPYEKLSRRNLYSSRVQTGTLAEKAEQALQYLKGYYPNGSEFVVIEVEGYNCVACLCDEFYPYELGSSVAPFDENQIYPVQGLTTKYAFQR